MSVSDLCWCINDAVEQPFQYHVYLVRMRDAVVEIDRALPIERGATR